MQKDRITIAVCVNATGSDRLKLLVIYTAKRPRDFGKTWQASDFVDYFDNKKAWMNMKACAKLLVALPLKHVAESSKSSGF